MKALIATAFMLLTACAPAQMDTSEAPPPDPTLADAETAAAHGNQAAAIAAGILIPRGAGLISF